MKQTSKKTRSLRFNIWLYFLLFIVIVFILQWLFQVVFLEKFYETMKINTVIDVASKMVEAYTDEDYTEEMKQIALDNDICYSIIDKYGRTQQQLDLMGGQCLIHGFHSNTAEYVYQIQGSPHGIIYTKIYNQKISRQTLLLGTVLGDSDGNFSGYLLINSSLEPVNATANIIKRQMTIITAMLIILGLIISFVMSKMIAEPIVKITKSAENLAKGDYTTTFEGGNYIESQKLANTLNYASKEISKVDTLQRDLIANVSHDLRTPLTMLKAYAEMIRDLSGDNPVKRNEHLNIIIEETDRLAALVNDMLDLSKLESGGQKLNYSTFGIRSKLEDIIERYQGISGQTGYDINFQGDDEVEVTCDVVKIEQVIYNLINNAVNYTGEDKKIFIKQINNYSTGFVRVEVTDTGAGISEENIKLIFDKYYRSEKHKREVVGTGLGLSIVKAVLKKHNFSFGVQSKLGEGSTFWFEIKMADGANSTPLLEKAEKTS